MIRGRFSVLDASGPDLNLIDVACLLVHSSNILENQQQHREIPGTLSRCAAGESISVDTVAGD